ncbi:MAG: di-trans,poly-cis-decaprenylcistransferase [Hyphomicrobiaceae bacterium]
MQSNLNSRIDVGIIMDGNGRWAERRGLSRSSGHYAGVSALRSTIEAGCRLALRSLTIYAFSSANWMRPKGEVAALMTLIRNFLSRELASLTAHNVRLTFIGRRDRLQDDIVSLIKHAENVTSACDGLHVRIALDYSGRESILAVADRFTRCGSSIDAFGKALAGDGGPVNVDVIIRTGGEQRLSDFLLWEGAYAELIFLEKFWPDFGADDLEQALCEFRRRNRRFGALDDSVGVATPQVAS